MNKFIKNCRKINLTKIIDSHDGIISIAEENKNVPFNIKRVYYIYGFESEFIILLPSLIFMFLFETILYAF